MHPTASQLTSNASRGLALLNDPVSNKGTAFTSEERKRCGLEGLMPPSTNTLERQVERVLGHLDGKPNDLERYIYLVDLCDRNEILFYRTVISNCRRASFRSSSLGPASRQWLPCLWPHLSPRPRQVHQPPT
jgi:malate dehydrogenase (oxaloacetate-decarboxylating)(NADP+)